MSCTWCASVLLCFRSAVAGGDPLGVFEGLLIVLVAGVAELVGGAGVVAQGAAADEAWGSEWQLEVAGDLAETEAEGVGGVVGEDAEVVGAAVRVGVEGVVSGAVVQAGEGGFGLRGEVGDEFAPEEGAVGWGVGGPAEAEEVAELEGVMPQEEEGGVEGGVLAGGVQESVEVGSGGEGVVAAFGGEADVVEEGVAGDEVELAQGAVEGAQGDDAAVAGVGSAGGAFDVRGDDPGEPGVEVGWGVEEVDVVAQGGGEDGAEVAGELCAAAADEVGVVEGSDEDVGVVILEGVGDFLGEVVVGVGHVVECMRRQIGHVRRTAVVRFSPAPAQAGA